MRSAVPRLRCAIYTRVSTDAGLEQEFNSLDNQREAAEAYIRSQAQEGWRCLPTRYDGDVPLQINMSSWEGHENRQIGSDSFNLEG